MHNALSREDGDNFIAFTERASDSRNPERDGNISIGLILDKSFKATAGTIDGHAVLKFKVNAERQSISGRLQDGATEA